MPFISIPDPERPRKRKNPAYLVTNNDCIGRKCFVPSTHKRPIHHVLKSGKGKHQEKIQICKTFFENGYNCPISDDLRIDLNLMFEREDLGWTTVEI